MSQSIGSALQAEQTTVLLIDDDPDVLTFYQDVLTSTGYRIEIARDGNEAAHLVSLKRYDVIVSDLCMPGMDGIGLLKTVRRTDLDVPVILSTGTPDAATAIEAIEYGAYRYLTKPVAPSALRRVVEQAAGLSRMARTKREAIKAMTGTDGFASDRAGLEATFERALAFSWMAYQPIVCWSRRNVFGYEALARTADPTLNSPMLMIETAEKLGRLVELGRRFRQLVAETISVVPVGSAIFMNVHPHDLEDEELYETESPLALAAERIVIEITERASLDSIPDVMRKIQSLREIGYRIAIDDLGAGHAGLNTFAKLEPDIAKIDMGLIRGIDKDPVRRKVVRSMAGLCADLNIVVVTEGVETSGERDVLLEVGCDVQQGYLFGRPNRQISAVSF